MYCHSLYAMLTSSTNQHRNTLNANSVIKNTSIDHRERKTIRLDESSDEVNSDWEETIVNPKKKADSKQKERMTIRLDESSDEVDTKEPKVNPLKQSEFPGQISLRHSRNMNHRERKTIRLDESSDEVNSDWEETIVNPKKKADSNTLEENRCRYTLSSSEDDEELQDMLDDYSESSSSSSDSDEAPDVNECQQEEGIDIASDTARKVLDQRLEIPQEKVSYMIYPAKILGDVMIPCLCGGNCVDSLSSMKGLVPKIQALRLSLWTLVQGPARQSRLMDLIKSSRVSVAEKENKHCFEGILFCRKKWIDILGISRATYYRSLKDAQKDIVNMDRIPKLSHRNSRGLEAAGFIEMTIQKYADFSPVLQKRVLPPVVTKRYLWEEYKEEKSEESEVRLVSEHHFYKVLNLYFKDISFAKKKYINPCSTCLVAGRNLRLCRNANERTALKNDLQEHLNRQRKERLDYYAKREKATKSPRNFLSLIIDGMDQAKTGVPHFRGWARPKEAQQYLKTHITGLVVHGRNNMFFVDMNEFPHDPNMTCTCIINALCQHAVDGCLPPTLYIQCDNCGRENKNKYLLGFLCYLCQKGYVREVFLSFLMKGHTHEDIDQRFSKISHHMRGVDALSIPSLLTEINSSFRMPCYLEQIGTIWDVRSWISESLNNMINHSFAHQFWIYTDIAKHVAIKARLWSTDEWYPSADEDPIDLLLFDQSGNQCLPTGSPSQVIPDFDKLDLGNFQRLITKMRNHINYKEKENWDKFFENPHAFSTKRRTWPLLNLRAVHTLLTVPQNINSFSEIQEDLQQERDRPKIKARKRMLRQ